MSDPPATWSWSPPAQEKVSAGSRSLADRLQECAGDRSASGRAVTREAAEELKAWLAERPRGWGQDSHTSAGLELEQGWDAWSRAHGWRGPCASLLDSLRRAHALARGGKREGGIQRALTEELDYWLLPETKASRSHNPPDGEDQPWTGEALTPGARLPSRRSVAEFAAASLEHGENVLVYGYSETVALALCVAQDAGKQPKVTVGVGVPDQSGKRMARELAERDVQVRLVWDAVALASAPGADRIWLGTDALGPGRFIGLVGTELLLGEAKRAEVPVDLLATCDKWVPGGELALPIWGADETWNLWSQAPQGAALESQPYESTSWDLVGACMTEHGLETLADFSLRGMRTDTASACVEL
jgi:hypothetical protein